ncbi:SWIM zinc finger family protein [Sphingosinicella sp. BN140058]|uniref:SWIM zinc finger family protein n=1 Tax=Sphingosinicella sp. BN140058 TaxID=1892855 RepID=UPI00101318EC|nr:SWIM zinc finger family protein [Sphingosinicella sp. BN140058]QAY78386.1 SWIM zinc finger family protein [Sphingosinicella sp. BN140058]
MAIDLRAVEQLATDQASLKAAAGLAKAGKWSAVGASSDGALIWGQCAGSGANPYRVMADLRDLGNKCTCPSRKFPCKHVLALLWLNAERIVPFAETETPDWVSDWLGRRRGGGAGRHATGEPSAPKDLEAARAPKAEMADPQAAVRREAAAAKRTEETQQAILDALDALEQWIGDQLRLGLGAFIDDATARCRRIAARMVDGKAAALAGRLDELPARLLALPMGERVRGAVVELGKLVLLARAFRARPRDPEIRRAVATTEPRETLLADPAAMRVTSTWEVLAELVETRRDGLVSQATWLLNLETGGPAFAMLLDFHPATAGRRASVFTPGERFAGELVFYPAALPVRAILLGRTPGPAEAAAAPWPRPIDEIGPQLMAPLLDQPWAIESPVLLPAGRLAADAAGALWWRAADGTTLPLADAVPRPLLGTALDAAAALWSNGRLTLLAAATPWGRLGARD